ncbi:hypothetical protein D039_2106B, partial [Vibrio parahaemolyticus EKP-028]
VLTLI